MITLGVLLTKHAWGQSLSSVCTGSTETYAVEGLPGSVFIWEVDDENIHVENYGDTADITWSVPGIHLITVKEISQFGCEGAPVYAYVEVGAMNIDLGDDITICEGQSATLDAGSFDSYLWSTGSTDASITTAQSGNFWVQVTSGTCSGSDTVSVSVVQGPSVDLGNDTSICGDDYIELDAGNYNSYTWHDGSVSQYYTVNPGRQTITVQVTDENGCHGGDTLNIFECSSVDLLGQIPNAFTPNGDGTHDTWEIDNISIFPYASVEIFDRWGRLVYSTTNGYNNDWNGTDRNGNELPMDSYHYVIDVNVDEVAPITGTVTIIR
ncbi:MAG: gliding motility-associated C-terminal domain-containing protein [Bacteroidota bacterium]